MLLMMAGGASLVYRIRAEERILAHDAGWASYVALVRYRLLPGLWWAAGQNAAWDRALRARLVNHELTGEYSKSLPGGLED